MAIALPLPHPRRAGGDHGTAARPRRPLTLVPRPGRRPRRPHARGVVAYGFGATVGFLLAALASAPGGEAVVAGQMQLAGAAAAVTSLAALRSRAVARRARRATRRR